MGTETTQSTKDRLRSLTIGRKVQFVTKVIDYYPPIYKDRLDKKGNVLGVELKGNEKESVKVEVRQPSIKVRNELIKRCMDKDGNMDNMEFMVQSAILLVYDPDSGEPLFTKEDYDSLISQPSGGFVDQFSAEAMGLLSVETSDENFTD